MTKDKIGFTLDFIAFIVYKILSNYFLSKPTMPGVSVIEKWRNLKNKSEI